MTMSATTIGQPDMELLAPRYQLPRARRVDRTRYLCDLCRGKRVLHLGCVAWPATEMLYRRGELLHSQLMKVAGQLAGFDIAEEGLDVLRRDGVAQLYQADLLERSEFQAAWQRLGWEPEVIVAGELLEHLDLPGAFLRNCSALMAASACLVITVPNAFSIKNYVHALLGREKVAPDHIAYFSVMNMMELARRTQLDIDELCFFQNHHASFSGRSVDWLTGPLRAWRPNLSDGLLVRCRSTRST